MYDSPAPPPMNPPSNTVPTAQPQERPPSARTFSANIPPPGPANILLVDDDIRNLNVLESILSSPNHRLVRAKTPDEALLALIQDEFAAIVLDIRMPGMSGLELAQLIKQRKRSQHVPIIFLTAYFQEEKDVLQGYGVGAVDYLRKPLNPEILRSKVDVFVNLFQTTRALATTNGALEVEVAQRQKAEAALRQINAELENRVQERTADLSEANRKLRASEERYRLILENALEYAIFTLDTEGRVAGWNSGAERVVGYADHEIIGRPLDILFAPEDRQSGKLKTQLSLAFSNGRTQDERWFVRKDGSLFWASGVMMVLRDEDNHHVGFLKILGDRTSRKRADEALREAKAEAEAASRAKDDFLAVLSHELRTPLTPAILIADERAQDRALPAEVRQDFTTIQTGIELEVRLIDDLLDLTRIARGKLRLDFRPVDLHGVVSATWDLLRFEAAEKQLRVNVDLAATQPSVSGDPVRLHQIFWNLIKNAVKFTPPKGEVSIQSRVTEPGKVCITIEDNGIGIEPADLDRVFLPFDQGHRGEGFGGLGLGLAISRRLAELHGGRIIAHSHGRGRGTSFCVELPLSISPVNPDAATTEVGGHDNHTSSRRVLLIEDHAETMAALEGILIRRGFEVVKACTMREARDIARRFPFDLVLSDLGLPDGSGHELMPELRKLRPNCTGIALSGYGMDSDVKRSMEAGFAVHLIKPVTARTLENALRKALREPAPPTPLAESNHR